MSIHSQSAAALRLYRSILSEARKFNDYSLRSYIERRTKEQFNENKNISDVTKIKQELLKAQD